MVRGRAHGLIAALSVALVLVPLVEPAYSGQAVQFEAQDSAATRSSAAPGGSAPAEDPPEGESPSEPTTGEGSPKPLAQLKFEKPIVWHLLTDVSVLFVYSGDKLYAYDELDAGRQLFQPLELPDLGRKDALLHVPATNFLIVRNVQPKEEEGKDEEEPQSIGLDAFYGDRIWKADPLPPSMQEFPFYEKDRIVLKSWGDLPAANLIGVNYLTGDRWQKPGAMKIARTPEDLIFSEATGSGKKGIPAEFIEPADGTVLWSSAVPNGFQSIVLGKTGRVLYWNQKEIRMIQVRAPSLDSKDKAAPAEGLAEQSLWKTKSVGGDPKILGIAPVGEDRLFVYAKKRVHLVDGADGKVLWSAARLSKPAEVLLSPDKKLGIMGGKDRPHILDIATGSETCQSLDVKSYQFGPWRTFEWLDETKVQVDVMKKGFREGLSVIDAASCKELWSYHTPQLPKFRMTAKQKGMMALQISMAVVAAYGAVLSLQAYQGALNSGNTALAQQWNSNYQNFAQLLGNAIGEIVDARRRAKQDWLAQGAGLAASRFNDRVERLKKNGGYYFVTGGKDQYQIIKVNSDTGQSSVVGDYKQPKVHNVDLDVAYQIGIALKDNNRTLEIFPFGAYEPVAEGAGLRVPDKR